MLVLELLRVVEGEKKKNRLAKERIKLLEVGGALVFEIEPGHGARSPGFARQR